MKKWGHLSSFHVSKNVLKKAQFFQFCADFSRKSRSIIAIYIYASGSSCDALSENVIVYCAMTYCFGDTSI